MFFSKLLYPVFAVISVATFAIASPVAAPIPVSDVDLAKRQTVDLASELQSFQSTIVPLFNELSQAASSGTDTGPILDQITTAFNDSTNNLKTISAADVIPGLDLSSIISIAVSIISTAVGLLGGLGLGGAGTGSILDGLLSGWLSALNGILPGITGQVGSALPLSGLPLSGLLQLLNLLSILGILSPILGGLGGL